MEVKESNKCKSDKVGWKVVKILKEEFDDVSFYDDRIEVEGYRDKGWLAKKKCLFEIKIDNYNGWHDKSLKWYVKIYTQNNMKKIIDLIYTLNEIHKDIRIVFSNSVGLDMMLSINFKDGKKKISCEHYTKFLDFNNKDIEDLEYEDFMGILTAESI